LFHATKRAIEQHVLPGAAGSFREPRGLLEATVGWSWTGDRREAPEYRHESSVQRYHSDKQAKNAMNSAVELAEGAQFVRALVFHCLARHTHTRYNGRAVLPADPTQAGECRSRRGMPMRISSVAMATSCHVLELPCRLAAKGPPGQHTFQATRVLARIVSTHEPLQCNQ